MPQKPRRPCRYPGCPGFCEQGQVFCKDHMEWSSDRLRGGADARGYDSRWRKARALFLKQHPLCAFCLAEGKVVPATVVDHRTGSRSARDAMTGKPGVGCNVYYCWLIILFILATFSRIGI